MRSTPKHFAVHSGPEPERHRFDAKTDARDLYDTYLPAFEACIREGGAYSVMSAYNRYMSEPCCANNTLLKKILRDDWKFSGYVVSDCTISGGSNIPSLNHAVNSRFIDMPISSSVTSPCLIESIRDR